MRLVKLKTNEPAKLELGDLMYVGVIMGVTGIILAFTSDVNDELQDDYITNTAGCNSTDTSACGYAYNITESSLEGTQNLSSKFGTIGTIAAIVIVIGLLLGGFGAYMKFR